jgi:hypothetical protein
MSATGFDEIDDSSESARETHIYKSHNTHTAYIEGMINALENLK